MNSALESQDFSNPLAQTIVAFLEEIGIPVRRVAIEENTFLPGVMISQGTLLVDEEKLLYPGDLLHEGGHIAVMSPKKEK